MSEKNILKVTFKNKTVETSILYCYKINQRTGHLDLDPKEIDEIRGTLIRFKDDTSISLTNIKTNIKLGKIINGRILYLPIQDRKYALRSFMEYYKNNITAYESKIKEFENKVKTFKLANNDLNMIYTDKGEKI